MEATRLYPQAPPAVLSRGFVGALALPTPDRVPLEPAVLDDPRLRARRAVAVDAVGALRLHVRNREGYAFLRPRVDTKMLTKVRRRAIGWTKYSSQVGYFVRSTNAFVPVELVARRLLEDDQLQQLEGPISRRQSNAIAGASLGPGVPHVVFFPTGKILQQARAFFGSDDDDAHPSGGFMSNAVETGAVIRQFAVMGRTSDYRPFGAEDVMVAARGEANCTILSVALPSGGDQSPRMRRKTKLLFSETVSHISASPHTETELAFVTGDGVVHCWEPEGGLQIVERDYSARSRQILRCEYSSHPRVLWTASKEIVTVTDLRASTSTIHTPIKLFDISGISSPLAEIYDLKRRSRSPFQFIVASGLATEIIDTRMGRLPLISWDREQPEDAESLKFGAVEEVNMSTESCSDRGAVLTISSRPKVATLFPFEKSQKRARRCPTLPLQSLRFNDEDGERVDASGLQYVTSDAPLDLRLEDGGENTHLVGICPLRDDAESNGARVYQLNTLGDLYSQRIVWSSGSKTKPYAAAVQPDLPCGVAAQGNPDNLHRLKRKLPIPVDAIIPEYPADALDQFNTINMKFLLSKYPRVKPEGEDVEAGKAFCGISDDEEGLADDLHRVCQPSATLFQLHRYVTDKVGVLCSSRDLLRFLSARAEFTIQAAQHQSIRPRRFRVVNARDPAQGKNREHQSREDPRLSTCSCSTASSLWPCESLACILPHALVVSSRMNGVNIEDVLPEGRRRPVPSPHYAQVLIAARAAFNQFEPAD